MHPVMIQSRLIAISKPGRLLTSAEFDEKSLHLCTACSLFCPYNPGMHWPRVSNEKLQIGFWVQGRGGEVFNWLW